MRLRQRPQDAAQDAEEKSRLVLNVPHSGKRWPSAQQLLEADPEVHGHLDKLGYPLFNLCTCFPVWKPRYFIACGGYLFRFADEHAERPKGVPIPLDAATFEPAENAGGHCILVSTLRKELVLRARSTSERDAWLQQLHRAKTRAIRQALGHAARSGAERVAARAGEEMFAAKLVQERREASLEMNTLAGPAAGVLPPTL